MRGVRHFNTRPSPGISPARAMPDQRDQAVMDPLRPPATLAVITADPQTHDIRQFSRLRRTRSQLPLMQIKYIYRLCVK